MVAWGVISVVMVRIAEGNVGHGVGGVAEGGGECLIKMTLMCLMWGCMLCKPGQSGMWMCGPGGDEIYAFWEGMTCMLRCVRCAGGLLCTWSAALLVHVWLPALRRMLQL